MPAWVIGNWKQNPASIASVTNLADALVNRVADLTKQQKFSADVCQLMAIPSHVHVATASQLFAGSPIQLGCQDVAAGSDSTGAYTGDCSAQQMQDAGANWALIGHSERRQYHHEDNATLATKIQHAFSQKLGVIFCIGESLADYDAGNTLTVLNNQLDVIQVVIDALATQLLQNTDAADITQLDSYFNKFIIAYEPVWAIGTGKVPSVAEVEEVHQAIKTYLSSCGLSLPKTDAAKLTEIPSLQTTPILYGGSVNPTNAAQFANSPLVDGALVGGASLDADKFFTIAEAFYQASKTS